MPNTLRLTFIAPLATSIAAVTGCVSFHEEGADGASALREDVPAISWREVSLTDAGLIALSAPRLVQTAGGVVAMSTERFRPRVHRWNGDGTFTLVAARQELERGPFVGNGWAFGPENVYFTEEFGMVAHWNGSTWSTSQAGPLMGNPTSPVWGSSPVDLYAAVSGGVFHSQGDGNWMKEDVGHEAFPPGAHSDSWFNGLWGFGDEVYTVGYDGHIFHKANGRWAHERGSVGENSISGVWGTSSGDVWAFRDRNNASGSSAPLLHSDGQGHWSTVAVPGIEWVNALAGTATEMLLAGEGGLYRRSAAGTFEHLWGSSDSTCSQVARASNGDIAAVCSKVHSGLSFIVFGRAD